MLEKANQRINVLEKELVNEKTLRNSILANLANDAKEEITDKQLKKPNYLKDIKEIRQRLAKANKPIRELTKEFRLENQFLINTNQK
jgi:hypothetical protein